MDQISPPAAGPLEQLQVNCSRGAGDHPAGREGGRVPEWAREFAPENLEGLVKFAYFGGFSDMGAVRRLRVDKKAINRLRARWYEEVRKRGCWLC